MLRRSILTGSYLMFPCMVGLSVCSEPIIRVLYTEKWIAMVPYMQLLCLSYLFWMVHAANLQVIQATGRSDIFLMIEVIKQISSLIIVVVGIRYGVMVLLTAYLVHSLLSFFINAYPNKQLANYGCMEQLKDLTPIILLNTVMGCTVYVLTFLDLNDLLLLALQVVTGVSIYLLGSILFKIESFRYLLSTVKEVLKK